MTRKQLWTMVIAGLGAGMVNGAFGAGGGLILVPLLTAFSHLEEDSIFPTSISVILPICLVSIAMTAFNNTLQWHASLPYLIGSSFGGILAGIWGSKVPAVWLHRGLGLMILWGGIRYLC